MFDIFYIIDMGGDRCLVMFLYGVIESLEAILMKLCSANTD